MGTNKNVEEGLSIFYMVFQTINALQCFAGVLVSHSHTVIFLFCMAVWCYVLVIFQVVLVTVYCLLFTVKVSHFSRITSQL